MLGIDPFYRRMAGAQWVSADDFPAMDVICLSHKHGEHSLDVPEFLRRDGSVLVAPEEYCHKMKTEHGFLEEKLVPAHQYQQETVSGFSITPFTWKHRHLAPSDDEEFNLIAQNDSPEDAEKEVECYGFYIQTPEGTSILNFAEGANYRLTGEYIEEIRSRFHPDVLIVGIQLDFEDHVAELAGAMGCRKVVIFHPHEKLFEKMGLESTPVEVYVKKIMEKVPGVEVVYPRVREELRF